MSTNDMIVRVATKLVKLECKRRYNREPTAEELAPMVPAYYGTAYALVRVMRDPTIAMEDAAQEKAIGPNYVNGEMCPPEDVWTAMIDAVLGA